MSSTPDSSSRLQLEYFSRVSASISHELKNVLAILNENAGLLQDYTALAEQGQALDVVRVRRLADSMLKQIGRGDAIIRRMNRFAHSADAPRAAVDAGEVSRLVCDLFGRTAATRGVSVEVDAAAGAPSLDTDPAALEALLGNLLDGITAALSDLDRLTLEVSGQADGVQISFAGGAQSIGGVAGLTQTGAIKTLLAVLQARAEMDAAGDRLVLSLPATIDA